MRACGAHSAYVARDTMRGRRSRRCTLINDLPAEKIEDQKARAAVKAQIEADKKARAEKAAREKALREGKPLPGAEQAGPSPPAAGAGAASAAPKVAGRDYPETRLQIRMASGGPPYTTTLPSDSSACIPAPVLARG